MLPWRPKKDKKLPLHLRFKIIQRDFFTAQYDYHSAAGKRLNSSCSDLTVVSLGNDADECGAVKSDNSATNPKEQQSPNLVNKQRVLPFVPPTFAGAANGRLIKPSEYLRSISGGGDKRAPASLAPEDMTRASDSSVELDPTPTTTTGDSSSSPEDDGTMGGALGAVAPPPPPPPAEPLTMAIATADGAATVAGSNATNKKAANQPLSAISVHDLNSVQLRRTEGAGGGGGKTPAGKTFSAPTRSMSLQCLQSEPFLVQKTDLIAELKMSKDITGIKKLKIERAKVEESKEKEMYTEISRQFTATKFVEKIPDKDNTGNVIPAWKRQMLAKKAAERARKELEEQMLKEAEEKRIQSIPQWKRQLMQKREEAEHKIKSTVYTPKVVDDNKATKIQEVYQQNGDEQQEDINNNAIVDNLTADEEEEEEEEEAHIIPWRAQLRKTNSKLNLLD